MFASSGTLNPPVPLPDERDGKGPSVVWWVTPGLLGFILVLAPGELELAINPMGPVNGLKFTMWTSRKCGLVQMHDMQTCTFLVTQLAGSQLSYRLLFEAPLQTVWQSAPGCIPKHARMESAIVAMCWCVVDG